eukprot:Filipodium_phascolosomae@DN1181_c0_g1_i1.p1
MHVAGLCTDKIVKTSALPSSQGHIFASCQTALQFDVGPSDTTPVGRNGTRTPTSTRGGTIMVRSVSATVRSTTPAGGTSSSTLFKGSTTSTNAARDRTPPISNNTGKSAVTPVRVGSFHAKSKPQSHISDSNNHKSVTPKKTGRELGSTANIDSVNPGATSGTGGRPIGKASYSYQNSSSNSTRFGSSGPFSSISTSSNSNSNKPSSRTVTPKQPGGTARAVRSASTKVVRDKSTQQKIPIGSGHSTTRPVVSHVLSASATVLAAASGPRSKSARSGISSYKGTVGATKDTNKSKGNKSSKLASSCGGRTRVITTTSTSSTTSSPDTNLTQLHSQSVMNQDPNGPTTLIEAHVGDCNDLFPSASISPLRLNTIADRVEACHLYQENSEELKVDHLLGSDSLADEVSQGLFAPSPITPGRVGTPRCNITPTRAKTTPITTTKSRPLEDVHSNEDSPSAAAVLFSSPDNIRALYRRSKASSSDCITSTLSPQQREDPINQFYHTYREGEHCQEEVVVGSTPVKALRETMGASYHAPMHTPADFKPSVVDGGELLVLPNSHNTKNGNNCEPAAAKASEIVPEERKHSDFDGTRLFWENLQLKKSSSSCEFNKIKASSKPKYLFGKTRRHAYVSKPGGLGLTERLPPPNPSAFKNRAAEQVIEVEGRGDY